MSLADLVAPLVLVAALVLWSWWERRRHGRAFHGIEAAEVIGQGQRPDPWVVFTVAEHHREDAGEPVRVIPHGVFGWHASGPGTVLLTPGGSLHVAESVEEVERALFPRWGDQPPPPP